MLMVSIRSVISFFVVSYIVGGALGSTEEIGRFHGPSRRLSKALNFAADNGPIILRNSWIRLYDALFPHSDEEEESDDDSSLSSDEAAHFFINEGQLAQHDDYGLGKEPNATKTSVATEKLVQDPESALMIEKILTRILNTRYDPSDADVEDLPQSNISEDAAGASDSEENSDDIKANPDHEIHESADTTSCVTVETSDTLNELPASTTNIKYRATEENFITEIRYDEHEANRSFATSDFKNESGNQQSEDLQNKAPSSTSSVYLFSLLTMIAVLCIY